jgi:hypothetical protein
VWTDAVRGVTKELNCNDNSIEETVAEGLTSFDSDGFTVGNDTSYNAAATYVAWCFKLDTTVTSGWGGSPSITPSKEMYNSTLGMSIIKWTGTGVEGTIPHSLGKKPGLMIMKNLSTAANWWLTHKDLSLGFVEGYQLLDTYAGETATHDHDGWAETEPTDELITIGTTDPVNGSDDQMIAYIFAETEFCEIGSYLGNYNADGPLINMGMSPKWCMVKRKSAGDYWETHDTVRDPYNKTAAQLWPSLITAETAASATAWDFLSNGIKFKTATSTINPAELCMFLAFGQPNGPIENNGL